MIKKGRGTLLFADKTGRIERIFVCGILVLIVAIIFSYFAFGIDSLKPTCNGKICGANEKCVFDPKQTATCVNYPANCKNPCPNGQICTIDEKGNAECKPKSFSFCDAKVCDAGKTCVIDLREILKCRNLGICGGRECTADEKCVIDAKGTASCQSAKPCSQISCYANQICKEDVPGAGKCVASKKITEGGVEREYTYESCLLEKPRYLDSEGNIQEKYCYGKDKIAGTSDDCGCLLNLMCVNDGSCKKFCSDGTPAETCSRNQPKYCDASGSLVNLASGTTNDLNHLNGCGCPENKRPNGDKGCSGENLFSFSTTEDFEGSDTGFSNVSSSKKNSIVLGYPKSQYITKSVGISNCKGGYYWIGHPVFNFWNYSVVADSMPLKFNEIVNSFNNSGYSYGGKCWNKANPPAEVTCPAGYKELKDYETYCFIPDSNVNPSFEIEVDPAKSFNTISINFGYPYVVTYRIEYLPSEMDDLEENWKVFYEGNNANLFSADNPDYFDGNYYSENDPDYRSYRAYVKCFGCDAYKTDDGRGIKVLVKNGKVVSGEGTWNGYKYKYFRQDIKSESLVSAAKIRLVPLTWENNAIIYRIFVYDTTSNLKLENGPFVRTSNGFTYLSGQFQDGGEYTSQPIFLDVPPEVLDYSTLRWNEGTEKRSAVSALSGHSHGTKIDALVSGMDGSYSGIITIGSARVNLGSGDWGYRYFGADYTNNALPPNGLQWDYSSGEGKRNNATTYVSGAKTTVYYDPRCVNDNAGINHDIYGSFSSIGKSTLREGSQYCAAFPLYSPGSGAEYSIQTADSAGMSDGILTGDFSIGENGVSGNYITFLGKVGNNLDYKKGVVTIIPCSNKEAINCKNPFDLTPENPQLSISFWIKLKSDVDYNNGYNNDITPNPSLSAPKKGYQTILIKEDINEKDLSRPYPGYRLVAGQQGGVGSDVNIVLYINDVSSYYGKMLKAVVPANDDWHHVVFSINNLGGNSFAYVDVNNLRTPQHYCKDEDSDNTCLQSGFLNGADVKNDMPLILGTDNHYSVTSFNGALDNLMIFKKALTPDEVLQVKNLNGQDFSDSPSDLPLKQSLTGYWKFDESSSAMEEKDETFESDFLVVPSNVDASQNPVDANRIVVEELDNNVQRIKVKAYYGDGSSDVLADYKKEADNSKGNIESVVDFDIPTGKKQFCTSGQEIEKNCFAYLMVELYSKSSEVNRMKLWDIGVYQRPSSNLDSADPYIRFLFRSAETKEGLESAPWCGPGAAEENKDTLCSLKNPQHYFAEPTKPEDSLIGSLHKGHRWFQWKAIFLSSGTHLTSPVLNKVDIGYYGGKDKPPVAAIQFDSDDIAVGREVVFDGTASEGGGSNTGIVSYKWEFSDGQVNDRRQVRHAFSNPGVNSVTLTVTDENGLTSKFSQHFTVAPYNCLATDEEVSGEPNIGVFSQMGDGLTKEKIIQDYAEAMYTATGVSTDIITASIDTPEEYMEAALYYTATQITYLDAATFKSCVQNAGINPLIYPYYNGETSIPLSWENVSVLKAFGVFSSGDCACPTPYCGDCQRFSIFYTTILRAMGINSKCIYSAITGNHATNIVNYHGKFRIVEPQVIVEDFAFGSALLEDKNDVTEVSKPVPHDESVFFVRGVVNDKVGNLDCSFGDAKCKLIIGGSTEPYYTTSKDAEKYVRNYPGVNGKPNVTNRCTNSLDRDSYKSYASSVHYFGMDGFGRTPQTPWDWDPATLFEDVCP